MNGTIYLRKISEDHKETLDNYIFSYNHNFQEYSIDIQTDLTKNFSDLISNSFKLKDSICNEIKWLLQEQPNDAEALIKLKEKYRDKENLLLENAEYVCFDFTSDIVADYVKNNSKLKNKKIVLRGEHNIDLETLDHIKKLFSNKVSNLYFELPGNSSFVNYEDCFKTLKTINSIANYIKKLNLSELEQVMLAYDIVRSRIYKEETDYSNTLVSRNLTSSLLGDKIVCLGYANIFNAILNKLKIKSKVCILSTNDSRNHARNVAYIKDKKYGIDGVYYFDTTFDRKKSEDDNSYLLSYKYFAKTKLEIDAIDKNKFIDKQFPYFSSHFMDEFRKRYNSNDVTKLPHNYLKSINFMSILTEGKNIIDFRIFIPGLQLGKKIKNSNITKEVSKAVEKFNKPLDADTLLEALYNVRKNEYYTDSYSFPFDREHFYKTVLASGWKFSKTPEEKLLCSVFDKEIILKNDKMRTSECLENKKLLDSAEGVKLAKVLKKAYEKKLDNNKNL